MTAMKTCRTAPLATFAGRRLVILAASALLVAFSLAPAVQAQEGDGFWITEPQLIGRPGGL